MQFLDLYLQIIPRLTSLFYNQIHYARWLVRFHDKSVKLGETNSTLHNAFEDVFPLKEHQSRFNESPTDLTLEQTINADVDHQRIYL